MTTTINLLPWREERRKQLQQEFVASLILAAIVGGLIFWLWKGYVDQQIADQRTRNNHIETKTSQLNKKISEIKDLKERRAELVARMEVIQNLQGNRPTIVYVFDQLARTLPNGVYYSEVKKSGELFTFAGIAESNNRISRLMRNLEESSWFNSANLQNVSALDDGSEANSFRLTVKQSSPNNNDEEEEK